MGRFAVPLLAAVLGAALALLVAGRLGESRTVVVQAPLGAATDGPGLTPAQIYARDAAGVAFVRADLGDGRQETGSGFVLDADGRIVTNAHVIQDGERLSVTLSGDTTLPATLLGADPATDLAVIKVDPDGLELHPLALGDSGDLRVGDPTVAIGNPFGFDRTLTTGVVSALGRSIKAPDSHTIDDVIQTDAAINPGNSGGPLIDRRGRVIGINSQIATGANGGAGSVGIGFAVPIDTARPVVRQLVEHGEVRRPWLGVTVIELDATMTALKIGATRGLLVQQVVGGSPAAAAGVRGGDRSVILNTGVQLRLGGDVLQDVDGTRTDDTADLQRALAGHRPGDEVDATVLRGGEPVTLRLTLADQPG